MENKIKRIIAILLAVCFVVSLTAMAASAQKHPVISNEGNNNPIGNAVSNEHVGSGGDCTNGSGGCPWRNLNPNDNSLNDPYTSS